LDSKALPSTILFYWRVLHDKIATTHNLIHRNIQLQRNNCVLCDRELEYTNILFFTCNEQMKIWNMITNWLGFIIVHHGTTKLYFCTFDFVGFNKVRNCILKYLGSHGVEYMDHEKQYHLQQ